MTRKIALDSPPLNRRRPLLTEQQPSMPSKHKKRFAELAGGTTAECAAICCCCPCALVNLLVLAVYKLPAGLCRKALNMKKRQQRRKKNGLLQQRRGCTRGCVETDIPVHPVSSEARSVEKLDPSAKDVLDLENEMWDRFHSTGFWRSPSQRDL